MQRGALVKINLNNIAHNFKLVKKLTNNKPVIAVVKADAYGHGSKKVAAYLDKLNPFSFATAFISEAIILRESGIKRPIIVFFDNNYADEIIKYKLTPVIYNKRFAQEISAIALKKNQQVEIHIKIDTGMGRVGFSFDNAINDIKDITSFKGVNITGIMSHFSEADLLDREFAEVQLKRFLNIKKEFSLDTKIMNIWHIANSAAVLSFPSAYLDAVRPGLMLYGCNPFTSNSKSLQKNVYPLKPAMSVRSKLIDIRRVPAGRPISYGRTFITKRDSLIGVVPVGYADGYSRKFSNKANVIVKGRMAPVVGRICMDLTMIDITDISSVELNDDVILLGETEDLKVSADELSKHAGTISYEILTTLGNLNQREYVI